MSLYYDFAIALRTDGVVVGWGNNQFGQTATIEGAMRFPMPQ
jgi:alpha-tubulin suppressor-like RCC1 family protein